MSKKILITLASFAFLMAATQVFAIVQDVYPPPSVPEPATLTLLSAGVLGLFGFLRKR